VDHQGLLVDSENDHDLQQVGGAIGPQVEDLVIVEDGHDEGMLDGVLDVFAADPVYGMPLLEVRRSSDRRPRALRHNVAVSRENGQSCRVAVPSPSMSQNSLEEKVRAAALAVLSDGPMHLSELVDRLESTGALAHLDGFDDGALADEVDEILLDTDDTWMSEEGMVALTASMLDGAIFSHHLTASEIGREVIDATPDLGAVHFELTEGLESVEKPPPGEWTFSRRGLPEVRGSEPGPRHLATAPFGWLPADRSGPELTSMSQLPRGSVARN